jgi:hypothetical protein
MRHSAKSVRRLALTVVIAVAVAAALAFVFFYKKAPAPAGQTGAQPVPKYAPQGELTPGFPRELILDSKAALQNSYTINYNPNSHQYTVSFNSLKSMTSLFGLYKDYFKGSGWGIVNEITEYKDSRGLYAVKGGAVASIAIIDGGKTRNVIVSYGK